MQAYSTESSDYGSNPNLLLGKALEGELAHLTDSLTSLLRTASPSERDLQLLRGLISLSHFTVEQALQGGDNLSLSHQQEIDRLREEVDYLNAINGAFRQQLEWFRDQIALSRASVGKMRLKATLKQSLQTTINITNAETGSIFLTGPNLVIQDYMLLRQNTSEEERLDLIGKVLHKGLAGWVAQQAAIALIPDTRSDNRWLDFPNQPYQVASALCVPMLRNQVVVGIITLTHPQRYHFTQEDADLVSTIAFQTAMVLENDRLSQNLDQLTLQSNAQQKAWYSLIKKPQVGGFIIQNNRFIQINPSLANLLGYPVEDLLKLPSIASLIAYEDRDKVQAAFHLCLIGTPDPLDIQFKLTAKNGQLITVAAQGLRLIYQGNPALVGILDPIT